MECSSPKHMGATVSPMSAQKLGLSHKKVWLLPPAVDKILTPLESVRQNFSGLVHKSKFKKWILVWNICTIRLSASTCCWVFSSVADEDRKDRPIKARHGSTKDVRKEQRTGNDLKTVHEISAPSKKSGKGEKKCSPHWKGELNLEWTTVVF